MSAESKRGAAGQNNYIGKEKPAEAVGSYWAAQRLSGGISCNLYFLNIVIHSWALATQLIPFSPSPAKGRTRLPAQWLRPLIQNIQIGAIGKHLVAFFARRFSNDAELLQAIKRAQKSGERLTG